jgi:formylglycine-generating enzyme required for sulfatase activity
MSNTNREAEQDRRREEENLRRIEEEKRRVAAEAERQRIQVENHRKPSRFFQELLLSVNNPTTYGLGALAVFLVVGSIVWLLNWKPSEAPTNRTEEQTSRTNQSTPDTPQKPSEPTTPVTVKSEAARPTEAKPLPEPAAAKPAMVAGKGFRDRLKIGGEGPEMIALPPGKFQMGDPQGKGGFEVPVHAVQIGRSFALGRYEVTFDEYDQFAKSINRMLPDDRDWGRGRRPVINVSWDDANAYVKWLSEQTQKRYRLPTEAEWEYAARAGAKTAYWWGEELVRGLANCKGCGSQWDNKQTAPVGSLKSNGFELFDTAGNIWEWVEDCWHDNYNGAPSDGRPWKDETGGKMLPACAPRRLLEQRTGVLAIIVPALGRRQRPQQLRWLSSRPGLKVILCSLLFYPFPKFLVQLVQALQGVLIAPVVRMETVG